MWLVGVYLVVEGVKGLGLWFSGEEWSVYRCERYASSIPMHTYVVGVVLGGFDPVLALKSGNSRRSCPTRNLPPAARKWLDSTSRCFP